MLLHCDYVLLAEGAELTTPFINLALVPEAASSLLLPQRIGHARAFEMFALGEPLPATSALAWGIANRIVPAATLRSEARRVADALAAKPQGALGAMKRLMRDAGKLVAQIEAEGAAFAQRLASPEAKPSGPSPRSAGPISSARRNVSRRGRLGEIVVGGRELLLQAGKPARHYVDLGLGEAVGQRAFNSVRPALSASVPPGRRRSATAGQRAGPWCRRAARPVRHAPSAPPPLMPGAPRSSAAAASLIKAPFCLPRKKSKPACAAVTPPAEVRAWVQRCRRRWPTFNR